MVERHVVKVCADHRDLQGLAVAWNLILAGEARAERRKRAVGERRPDQGNAERDAVVAESRGHGDRGHVEQVDEVGIAAEPCIELDRFAFDLGEPVDRRRAGYDQQVASLQQRFAAGLQGSELVLRLEYVARGIAAAGLDDAARHRQHLVEILLQRRRALGDPGTVEELLGFEERGVIDLARFAAEALQAFDRLPVQGFVALVAVEFQLGRNSEAKSVPGKQDRLSGPRIRIVHVAALHDLQDLPRFGAALRQHRYAVERAAGRDDAGGGDEAARRFQADQVVERRRHPARASGVGAEREARHVERYRDRRTRARAAADVIGPEGVAAGALTRPPAGQTPPALI